RTITPRSIVACLRSGKVPTRSSTIREEAGGYTAVDVADLEGEGPGGAIRKVRRALGARAFGFTHVTLPAGREGREHDHAGDGQEEVYVVVGLRRDGGRRGRGRYLHPGVFVRVDPDATRLPVGGPDGLEFVTFGAPLDGPYEPLALERLDRIPPELGDPHEQSAEQASSALGTSPRLA